MSYKEECMKKLMEDKKRFCSSKGHHVFIIKKVRDEKCVREKNVKEIQNKISRMNDRVNWNLFQAPMIKVWLDAYTTVLKELE